jgi:aspartate/methionine/tyrosine aminotransferase
MEGFIEKISPFRVMDILAKARKMPDAIHMEVGEPDLPPSERVQDAYLRAIRDRRFHYTPATGLMKLREKIAGHYFRKYRVEISPERILITPGTSGAFLVILSIITSAEKSIVLSDPSYPCYKNFSYFLKTEPIFVNVGRSENYEIKAEALREIADSAGAMIISSPSNPTGRLYNRETLAELISLSEEKDILFISDEIYHGLVYDRKEHTAIEFSDRAVVINGFSKYFCMPGFRVGWMILPEELVRTAEIIIQNIFIAANTPAQYAAVEAFDEEHLKSVRQRFRERRDLLYAELKDIFDIHGTPDGAFYIWADIGRYSKDAVRFCSDLLKKKAVALTPGIDFGINDTAHYIRFAYTREASELLEGVRRIKEFLSKRP